MNDQNWWEYVKEEVKTIARIVGLVTVGVALRRIITALSGNSEIAKTILGGGLDAHIDDAAKRDLLFQNRDRGESDDEPTRQ